MSSGFSHITDIRVRYAETDAMTFVYHGNYFVYFENARTEMLRAMGLAYSEIEKMGIFIVVLEAQANYQRPAKYDDLLHVKASINEMPSTRITIGYEITRNNNNELLVTGHTLHTFLNKETFRPTRPPKKFTDIMQQYFV